MTTLGHCRACRWERAKELNKRLARGDQLNATVEWADSKDFKISRWTLAKHKEHITDPRQTFVEAARSNPAIKGNVSNDEFLQAVIDAAASNAITNPEAITVSHGLKAAQIREAQKDKQVNVLMLLARAFTQRIETQPVELIEGSYTELLEESTLG